MGGSNHGEEELLVIDALFWYTGLIAWMLIAFGVIWTFVIERMASKRNVLSVFRPDPTSARTSP
jgi:hypothetical protein